MTTMIPPPSIQAHRARPVSWRRFSLAAVTMLLVAELAARLLATGLEPVLDWPRTDYVGHQQGLAPRS